LAIPNRNIFGAFKGEFEKMGMDPARESAFLSALNNLIEELSNLRGSVAPQTDKPTIIQQVVQAGSPAISISSSFDLTIQTNSFLQEGQLVHYFGSTLELADAKADRPANWYVKSNSGGKLVLSKLIVEGYVSNTGAAPDISDDGTLYLFESGGVTRKKADLITTEGELQSGVDFVQVVGVLNGRTNLSPRTGFVVGSLNFLSEQG
jgi:hypothetical protein